MASGMAGLALSSIELGQVSGRLTAKSRLYLNRYWVASAGVVIASLLLLGLLLGALIAPGAVAQALGWIGVLVNLAATLLYWALAVVAFILLVLLMPFVEWVRSLMADARPAPPLDVDLFRSPLPNLVAATPGVQNPAALEMLRWSVVVIALLLIAIAFLWAVRFLRQSEAEDMDEIRESVFSPQIMRDQLAELLRRWRGGSVHADYLSLEGEVDLRRRVRAVYQALLARAALAGIPRAPAKTPTEYQADLLAMAPTSTDALAIVTTGYERARYAAETPTDGEVEAVEAAWARINREGDLPAKP
ncbi:MAG: DUF4129 domain-containing protein [Anaerolineales bacterium]|nr:DUF4129 domain-containing protein [Anaerolineales bacterium]